MTTWFELKGRGSRRLWSLICLALFLTLQVFAGSDALHKAFHDDSSAPGHHCVVTLLTQGHVNAAAPAASLAVFVAAFLFLLPLYSMVAFSSSDLRLSPSRAPPRF